MTDTTPTAAEALVTAYCGWHIAPPRTETITLDGPGTRTLLLPSLHVTEISSVISDGTTLDPDCYDWSESGIVELRGGWFSRRLRGVSVALKHGYETMPADLAAVVSQIDGTGFGPQAVQVGQVRVQTADGVQAAGSILDRYKLPPRP